jgi:hypothetical protein
MPFLGIVSGSLIFRSRGLSEEQSGRHILNDNCDSHGYSDAPCCSAPLLIQPFIVGQLSPLRKFERIQCDWSGCACPAVSFPVIEVQGSECDALDGGLLGANSIPESKRRDSESGLLGEKLCFLPNSSKTLCRLNPHV